MNNNLLTKIKSILFIFIITATLSYAYYQSKGFIKGPILKISQPQNGISLTEDVLEINGFAKNIAYISLNDRQIFVDEEGNLKEKILLFPGYNIISLSAKDKYERKIEKNIEVVLLN